MDGSDGSSREWSSWSDWLGDGMTLAQRASAVAGQLRADWEDLSRQDGRWTTDTVMNEVVNSWERFTPVLGELVQHWVDGASEALRETWPDAGADLAAWAGRLDDTPLGGVVAPYAEVGRDVADRMVEGRFGSADAVEAWAVLGGMWAKDMWRLAAGGRSGDPGGPGPEHPGSDDG